MVRAACLPLCLLPLALAGPTQKWAFTAKTNLSTVSQYEVVVSHDGNTVFVPRQSHIVAVDAKTGEQKWEYSSSSGAEMNPALVSLDNSLLFAVPDDTISNRAEIMAISTATGQLVRTFSQKGYNAKPALSADGKTLYVSMYAFDSADDHVAAYDIATGTKKWGWKNENYIGACDVTVGPAGNIYVASYGHFALDSRGKQLWATKNFETGGAYCDQVFDGLGTRAAVASSQAGVLFLAPSSLGGTYGNLYAMDASTGEVRYMLQPSNATYGDAKGINTMPAASYRPFFGVYPVGTSRTDIYRLFVGDKSTGKEVASYQFPDSMIWGPTPPYLSPSGDTVFVAADTQVFALSPMAQVLWTFDLVVRQHFTHRIKASPTESVLFVTDGTTLRAIDYRVIVV